MSAKGFGGVEMFAGERCVSVACGPVESAGCRERIEIRKVLLEVRGTPISL